MRLLLLLLCILPALLAGSRPDFSGTWKTEGGATLRIEHHDPELVVETLNKGKRALQRYTTDGKESISTGIDGDKSTRWFSGARTGSCSSIYRSMSAARY